ncbi:hypothetical protein EIN_018640 [Entamoeba invadens IP1]|uniref:hypothetical protein n=1 Tax=Entamoeba invadens IP1 TaxID=370355 RepID=UPI0002C3DF52|nr:hypothetical protein EIN_018640 [Entamoeba invadens IP1]ELP90505.1 hypothetical protein EIN_018640 [Entamoeba invadens IP1]|eukprot:XP_004257276.1 hypothetical protein EIN_018640 [Entamoeba invadens IP1]
MIRLTKCPFCLLCALYVFTSLPQPSLLMVFGLIFSFLGDLLLLFEGNVFLIGMASFALTHILNGILFLTIAPLTFNPLAASFVLTCALFWTVVKNYSILPSFMRKIVYGYMSIICFGFYTSTMLLNTEWTTLSKVLIIMGYSSFVISDAVLSIVLWVKNTPFMHFVVMFTYYFAQFCISVGYVAGTTNTDFSTFMSFLN